ncbi:MAG: class I SAM-dependent methyltransferase [Pseudomonadota bacterium]
MPQTPSPVQITADGLIVLRTDAAMMDAVGAKDPFASWFVTDEGRRMATLAAASDPVFAVFNLARYRWFSERLENAATHYSQAIVLGAGYDTRPLWMEAFKSGTCRVFLVDMPTTISARHSILQAHGVSLPDWIVPVPCDLDTDDVGQLLSDAGFQPRQPSFVMAEGLFYYLQSETLLKLLSPAGLGLASGSTIHFDLWSNPRVDRLNEQVFERRGIRIFKAFPFSQEKDALTATLAGLEYEDITIASLDAVARGYWPPSYQWTDGEGWTLIEARVK